MSKCIRREADVIPACTEQCQGCSHLESFGQAAPAREAVLDCARMVRGRLAGREEASPLWLEINKIANMLDRHATALSSPAQGEQEKDYLCPYCAGAGCEACTFGPANNAAGCVHDWAIWPETDGMEQRCRKCGELRVTPEADKFWLKAKPAPAAPPAPPDEFMIFQGLCRSPSECRAMSACLHNCAPVPAPPAVSEARWDTNHDALCESVATDIGVGEIHSPCGCEVRWYQHRLDAALRKEKL